jgi:peptide/nickel transport system ATP-binding protein
MEGIPGSPPDLRALPSGCAFHPRCPWAMERCRKETPALVRLDGSDREAACWLHSGEAPVPAELDLPDPANRGPRAAAEPHPVRRASR